MTNSERDVGCTSRRHHEKPDPGDILVVDRIASNLVRVDPMTGTRTLLSDFEEATQGPLGELAFGVAVEGSGQILVTSFYNELGTNTVGRLFRVEPTTGTRTLLSDFGDSTPTTTSTSSTTTSTSPTTTTTTLPPPPPCECPPGRQPVLIYLGGQFHCICVFLEFNPDLLKGTFDVVTNVIKYADQLTKCSQKGIANLLAGKPSGIGTCRLAASAKYDRAAAEFQPPRCVDQDALRAAVGTAVQRHHAIVFCNQAGAPFFPLEFGGGWLPARAAWKTERGAQKLLVKHGKALGKCITKAISDVVRGKATRAPDCLATAHEKAVATGARLDFALPGFGPGTGCYEAPNDIGGLIDGVERLAGAFVPEVLCFE